MSATNWQRRMRECEREMGQLLYMQSQSDREWRWPTDLILYFCRTPRAGESSLISIGSYASDPTPELGWQR